MEEDMPKATSGITNLYTFQKFVNDVDDAPVIDINEQETVRYIIDETNNLIEKKCGRTFETTTYREWIRGSGTPYIVLNNYPVTRIYHCAASAVDLFTVEGTGFEVATVSSNNSSLVLTSIATTGTSTENVFNYSTYANVSSLVTAIDAVSGWDAETLSNYSDSLTASIRPVDSEWALDEKAYMRGPYLGISVRLCEDSDSIIESIGGGDFVGNIYIHYVAGYTLPECDDSGGTLSTEGNVPEGLTRVANEIILDTLRQRNEDSNMKSENMGDYSYTRDGISSCVDRRWKDLSLWARKVV